jgi:hypothetical protein
VVNVRVFEPQIELELAELLLESLNPGDTLEVEVAPGRLEETAERCMITKAPIVLPILICREESVSFSKTSPAVVLPTSLQLPAQNLMIETPSELKYRLRSICVRLSLYFVPHRRC